MTKSWHDRIVGPPCISMNFTKEGVLYKSWGRTFAGAQDVIWGDSNPEGRDESRIIMPVRSI